MILNPCFPSTDNTDMAKIFQFQIFSFRSFGDVCMCWRESITPALRNARGSYVLSLRFVIRERGLKVSKFALRIF